MKAERPANGFSQMQGRRGASGSSWRGCVGDRVCGRCCGRSAAAAPEKPQAPPDSLPLQRRQQPGLGQTCALRSHASAEGPGPHAAPRPPGAGWSLQTEGLWEGSPRSAREDQLQGPWEKGGPCPLQVRLAAPSVVHTAVSGGVPRLTAHQTPGFGGGLGLGGCAGHGGSVVWSIGS